MLENVKDHPMGGGMENTLPGIRVDFTPMCLSNSCTALALGLLFHTYIQLVTHNVDCIVSLQYM